MRLLLPLLILGALGSLQAQEPDLGTEAQRDAGKVIYEQKCAQCHGAEGEGDGDGGAYFRPAPRDLTSGTFKVRTTESGELPTDEDLKRVIRLGMPATGMPAWPDFGDRELTELVYYIKTFSEDFADPDMIVPPMEIPQAPAFTEASAQKGRKLFEENKCIDCHGLYGRMDGPSAPTLKDDWDRHIRPADLTKRWTYRGGPSREDIYRTFTTGLNGTPMPSYADLLEEEDRWNLVDYVFSLSADEPDYATVVIARLMTGEIDIEQASSLFDSIPGALFPMAGQVIEPGREFFRSIDAVDVKAVYSANHIAIRLAWNDMSADRSGHNSPAIPVPVFDPDAEASTEDFSDAVALQFPAKTGSVLPYFLFGDRRNAVDIWFADLAGDEAERFTGRGSDNITPEPLGTPLVDASYEDGEWSVIFVQERQAEGGSPFEAGSFVPVAFSLWDGFNKERGNKRGLSSWYYLYLEPAEEEWSILPTLQWGLATLLVQFAIVYGVRRKYANHAGQGPHDRQ